MKEEHVMVKDDNGFYIKLIKEEFAFGGKGSGIHICSMFDDWEKTRDRILLNQEKAIKYDDLMKANAQVVQDNIKYSEIFPIIKRLRKRIEELDEYIIDQYENHHNVAQIEEAQLEELQKILGVRNETK